MSPFLNPKKLGSGEASYYQPLSSLPVTPSYLLLEDGSFILLESGTTDKFVLES